LSTRAELLKTIGVAVLVLGVVSASLVFWSGEKHPASSTEGESLAMGGGWKDTTLPPEDLKGSSRNIEMNYGKVAVLIVSWLHWWQQLKPHEFLAIMIVGIATLTSLGCFMAAKR
jgi:hypothetical protein